MNANNALALLVATALAGAIAPAKAQTVGSVGAVNPDATGAPPGRAKRTLTLGLNVVQNERVETNANGSAQLVFVDRSALNIGRNSSVVIDRFVYDPASGAGEMTTTMTRGVLRFVGGKVSHQNGATIRTPTATIGVRGGVASIAFDQQGGLHVIHHFGNVTVNGAGGSVTLRRPGFETVISNAGQPGAPQRVSPAFLTWVMAQIASGAGQHGGAVNPPTNSDAARFGVGATRIGTSSPNFDLPGGVNNLVRNGTTPHTTVAPPHQDYHYPR